MIYRRFIATRGNFFTKSPIYLPQPIYRRYFGDFCRNISISIFLHEISCRPLSIHDISTIYPDIFLLACIHVFLLRLNCSIFSAKKIRNITKP